MKVEFNNDHKEPKDCQVFIALTGNKEFIRNKLTTILYEIEHEYGKPIQENTWTFNGSSQIITPLWNKKPY